jgi:FtsP/CotA-like multicopper oxidase with cupredoxin domain
VGGDGGFLPAPARLRTLVLAPGERADLVVDFSGVPSGRTLVLQNDAPTPFPVGDPVDPRTTGMVMQIRVVPARARDSGRIPSNLVELPVLERPTQTRTLTLIEKDGPHGPLASLLDGKTWSEPVSEVPALGATEVWEFVNLTGDTHPMHLHLV